MPSQRQIMVEPVVIATYRPYGTRNQANLDAIFPQSPLPMGKNQLDDEKITKRFNESVLDGDVLDGFGFPSFSPQFTENPGEPAAVAPDFSDVKTGGGGLPASPYVPNPSSPKFPSTDASSQPEYKGTFTVGAPEYGSGLGGLVSPSVTSMGIESQHVGNGLLGAYISGKSYAGSDGSA